MHHPQTLPMEPGRLHGHAHFLFPAVYVAGRTGLGVVPLVVSVDDHERGVGCEGLDVSGKQLPNTEISAAGNVDSMPQRLLREIHRLCGLKSISSGRLDWEHK